MLNFWVHSHCEWINIVKNSTCASTWLENSYIAPDFMFVFQHGRKIAHVLYIYPSTGTENNSERVNCSLPWFFCFCLIISKLLSWDITLMTRCRGSELRQAIPEDVQGIALDSRPIECIPLRNCAREERVLAL